MALEESQVITIARKTLPALRATAMRDFFEILETNNIYDPANHNKSENIYHLGNSMVEFVSLDQPQKVRGRKRKTLWINEANDLTFEDWRQLIMRTSGRIFLDFNPSDEYSWIYDRVLTRKDASLIKSTYKDNPFLEESIIQEIERIQEEDPEYWKIYGLGERAASANKIYTNWELYQEEPEGGETVMGMDFGFNHPFALTQVTEKEKALYVKQIIYKSFLTNSERINLANELGVSKTVPIYPDMAEAAAIAEWKAAGFNMQESDKSVKDGIDFVKRHKIYLHYESVDLQKEIKAYAWKTKNGQNLDEPVKIKDDGMDSMRYPVYSHWGKPKKKFGFI